MAVIHQKWRVMLLCFSSALTFWLFHALNKDYTTTINYPIHFVIDESKRVFVEEPPQTIPLEVTSGGWKLLRYMLKLYVKPIDLPVAKVARRGRISPQRLYVFLTHHLKDVKVNRIMLDTLDVRTQPKPIE